MVSLLHFLLAGAAALLLLRYRRGGDKRNLRLAALALYCGALLSAALAGYAMAIYGSDFQTLLLPPLLPLAPAVILEHYSRDGKNPHSTFRHAFVAYFFCVSLSITLSTFDAPFKKLEASLRLGEVTGVSLRQVRQAPREQQAALVAGIRRALREPDKYARMGALRALALMPDAAFPALLETVQISADAEEDELNALLALYRAMGPKAEPAAPALRERLSLPRGQAETGAINMTLEKIDPYRKGNRRHNYPVTTTVSAPAAAPMSGTQAAKAAQLRQRLISSMIRIQFVPSNVRTIPAPKLPGSK